MAEEPQFLSIECEVYLAKSVPRGSLDEITLVRKFDNLLVLDESLPPDTDDHVVEGACHLVLLNATEGDVTVPAIRVAAAADYYDYSFRTCERASHWPCSEYGHAFSHMTDYTRVAAASKQAELRRYCYYGSPSWPRPPIFSALIAKVIPFCPLPF